MADHTIDAGSDTWTNGGTLLVQQGDNIVFKYSEKAEECLWFDGYDYTVVDAFANAGLFDKKEFRLEDGSTTFTVKASPGDVVYAVGGDVVWVSHECSGPRKEGAGAALSALAGEALSALAGEALSALAGEPLSALAERAGPLIGTVRGYIKVKGPNPP